MKQCDNKTMKQGFSYLEIVVVISIIILLTAIILPNYRAAASQFALERSAYKLAQDIRRTAEMAMSARECFPPPVSCPTGGGVPPGGYGFYIDKSTDDRYIIYADSGFPPKDERYTSGEEFEIILLEKEVYVKDFNPPSGNFSINFKPPAPTVKLKDGNGQEENKTTIILALRNDSTKTKTITVNKAGLIDVK